jgi:transketolase
VQEFPRTDSAPEGEFPAGFERTLDVTRVRRVILEQARRANVGHIGSCLSVVEILCAVYEVLRTRGYGDIDRDRFILSKGHAALALYGTLAVAGLIGQSELDTFCGDDSLLGVHPEAGLPGIDFSTGSLGHGLGIACGAALAARVQRSGRRVFCLMSDAELNEGSIWEAAMFAAHHKLGRLTAIVDLNGQQALGSTRDILDLSNLAERWRAFGWHTAEVDGHSLPELRKEMLESTTESAQPKIVLARTVLGRGVRFMEEGRSLSRTQLPANPVNWHYLPMSEREYELAMTEVAEVQRA